MNRIKTGQINLYNVATPEVEGHLSYIVNNGFDTFAQVMLVNHKDTAVVYDYGECYPIVLENSSKPVKIRSHLVWLLPGSVYHHSLYPSMFVPLTNLEYMEWKYEQHPL